MELRKKEILVTGGAGFIGSHLCAKLLSLGHTVYCLDNLSSGNLSNLDLLQSNSFFHFIEADVCNPIDLPVGEIYHLACPASPLQYQGDPIATTRTCILGAINILELAEKMGAKVLFTSTSEVYGDPLVHPQSEEYLGNVNPIGIRACYDEGKRCAETLFFDYHRKRNVKISVARIFNTYGPHMQREDGRVISNFIVQALANAPLTVYGTGEQTRSFAYVQDLIEGLLLLMASEYTGPINLGNPQEYTVKTLAGLVLEMTQSSSSIEYLPLPDDDPKRRRPDITKATTLLGWSPRIPLQEGLRETIRYFLSEKAHNRAILK